MSVEVKPLSADEIALIEARDAGDPGPFVCGVRDSYSPHQSAYPCPSCGAEIGRPCHIVRRILATLRARDQEIASLKTGYLEVQRLLDIAMRSVATPTLTEYVGRAHTIVHGFTAPKEER